MWQAHVSQLALKHVVAALARHPDDADIQSKGMVVLGVLGQVNIVPSACMTEAQAVDSQITLQCSFSCSC